MGCEERGERGEGIMEDGEWERGGTSLSSSFFHALFVFPTG